MTRLVFSEVKPFWHSGPDPLIVVHIMPLEHCLIATEPGLIEADV